MENNGKSYYFIFNDDCFDRNSQRSNISHTKQAYSRTIYEMNRAVEALDRYDDFDSLKIQSDKYERTGASGDYGIQRDHAKHGSGAVILKHQRDAATAFLKDLRGFGLLADVVGSGKTFEAAVIISELAVRGKIKSMLLVVPGQVYDSWVNVLEMQFGLGKDVLFEADAGMTEDSDFRQSILKFDEQNRPDRPIIVKTEDFVNWNSDLAKMLFDVIVVDEAHHLCKEDGEYAKAMKLLSMMMETKKKANSTYCLLLSATPHSGNLAHMFRLWYFIRTKGGRPSDFDEKDDGLRTDEYKHEKEYYHEHICRGATTVMEFIKKVKKDEVMRNYTEKFYEYLSDSGVTSTEFNSMTSGEQQMRIDEFLDNGKYADIRETIMRHVASAYHNGVLRSIMIRQPATSRISKKKEQINYLFYPALPETKKSGSVVITFMENQRIRINLDKFSLNDEDRCIRPIESDNHEGEYVSFSKYVTDNCGNYTENAFRTEILSQLLRVTADKSAFTKEGFLQYYQMQMTHSKSPSMRCIVKPFYDKDDLFTAKFEQTKKLLTKHSDKRVIIFFDYELKKAELMHARFESEILADEKFKKRVIIGTAKNKEKTLEQFEKKEDAILVVKDASFTEGVNLQSCNIIINFQVTPDPLAMDQRVGRIFRLGQKNDVIIYSLANMHKLEGFALMYFMRIGLMSSNSGDATIIAGSNNERMVAIQCEKCGNVELCSQEDYETRKKNNDLFCEKTDECKEKDPRGTEMQEISVYDFKCDKCSTVFARSVSDESGYLCVAINDTGRSIMCNQGAKGDRRLYCRKICAMSNCSRFKPGECLAVEEYKKNRSIGDQDLYMLCNRCPNRSKCPEKCRPYIGTNGISECSTCKYATCKPKPHVIEFDDRWEADCPVCKMLGRGKLGRIRPVVARTFAAYLRASWDFAHDGGKAFCDNLLDEAKKVEEIQDVLSADMAETNNE